MDELKIPKPEYRWYYVIPFTRGRKDYIKDRKQYEYQFLTKSEKTRHRQLETLNYVSTTLITVIVGLWSTLPQVITLPDFLKFMQLGMEKVDWKHNWGNAVWLTIIPSAGGTIIHKVPNMPTGIKVKWILNIIIKIIPFIILLMVGYIPITQQQYRRERREERKL